MSYPIVQIGDLALDEPGSFKIGPFGSSLKKDELVSSGIPVIGIENILPNEFVPSYRKYITEQKYQDLAQYTVQPGDIAVTTMGTIGRAAVVPEGIGTTIIDSHLFRMRVDKTKVYPPYLCYAINGAPSVINHLEKMSRGAIMDGLNTTILKESPLALPPLTEQKQIASLLRRADRLRKLRETAHDLGDALLQSAFLEMFGDPVRNEKKWEEKNLNELCRNITDGTHDTPDRTDSGVPFITSKNIRPYEIDLSVLEYVSEETHQEIIKRTNPQYGDVIYTNIGANLGNAAMNKLPFSFSLKNVALLQPDKKQLNSHYLEALLNNERFKENLIYLSSAGGAQQFITLEILRTISIPYPPLSLQEEFAGVVARVESLRGRMGESARQVDGLFESLLNEAFHG